MMPVHTGHRLKNRNIFIVILCGALVCGWKYSATQQTEARENREVDRSNYTTVTLTPSNTAEQPDHKNDFQPSYILENVTDATKDQPSEVNQSYFTDQSSIVRKTNENNFLHESIKNLEATRAKVKLSDHHLVPRIIHQTWKNRTLSSHFKKTMSTWLKMHPGWEYWFWTDEDVRLLLSRCFGPLYTDLFNNYNHDICRGDSMRYFVLYIFGGLYVDLDMEALRPNEEILDGYPCIMAEENYVHSVVGYDREKRPNLINSYMACRPKHPFMRMLVNSLPSNEFEKSVLEQTGPFLQDRVYRLYNRIRIQNNFTDLGDDVYVLKPSLTNPTVDKWAMKNFIAKCQSKKRKSKLYKAVCDDLAVKKSRNIPEPESFADHHWFHTYMAFNAVKLMENIVDINSLVSGRVNITQKVLAAACEQ